MAPRKPRTPKIAPVETFGGRILSALEFLSVCQKPKGNDQQTHCFLGYGRAVAFDGIIAAGITFPLDIIAAPETSYLVSALRQCGPEIALTQLSPDRLSLRSGAFQAITPCIPVDRLQPVTPDARIAAIDDRLRAAFKVAGTLASDKAQKAQAACVQLRPGTVVGSDGVVILEAYHGIDLPFGLLIPKAALMAIHKVKLPMEGFGFSDRTATFYFNDGRWIRTQLYKEKYWDVDKILSVQTREYSIPDGLFAAIERAGKFSTTGFVYCENGRVSSHDLSDANAVGSQQSIEVPGVKDTRIYNWKSIKEITKLAQWMDDQSRPETTYFGSATVRGAIEHATIKPKQPTVQYADSNKLCDVCGLPYFTADGAIACDCIPF